MSRKVCELHSPPNHDIVYLVYKKYTNVASITRHEPKHAQTKTDIAGVFTNRIDAETVSKCLTTLLKPLSKVDKNYELKGSYIVQPMPIRTSRGAGNQIVYIVEADYVIKDGVTLKKNQFKNERVLEIFKPTVGGEASTQMKNIRTRWTHTMNHIFYRPGQHDLLESNKIKRDRQVHVMRYRMNDVMPTIDLEDYNLEKHKETMEKVGLQIQQAPYRKFYNDIVPDIKFAPPSHALKRGGVEYRKYIQDPEFQKRWQKWSIGPDNLPLVKSTSRQTSKPTLAFNHKLSDFRIKDEYTQLPYLRNNMNLITPENCHEYASYLNAYIQRHKGDVTPDFKKVFSRDDISKLVKKLHSDKCPKNTYNHIINWLQKARN